MAEVEVTEKACVEMITLSFWRSPRKSSETFSLGLRCDFREVASQLDCKKMQDYNNIIFQTHSDSESVKQCVCVTETETERE